MAERRTPGEFEDWQMIPWLVGLGYRLERLDGTEPPEIQQIIARLREFEGTVIEGPLIGQKHIIGRVQDLTVRIEPSYEQCLQINELWDGPVANRRAILILKPQEPEDNEN